MRAVPLWTQQLTLRGLSSRVRCLPVQYIVFRSLRAWQSLGTLEEGTQIEIPLAVERVVSEQKPLLGLLFMTRFMFVGRGVQPRNWGPLHTEREKTTKALQVGAA